MYVDQSDKWEHVTLLPTRYNRRGASFCVLPRGVFVCGGVDSQSASYYNSRSKSWVLLGDMAGERRWHSSVYTADGAAQYQGAVYVVGGYNSQGMVLSHKVLFKTLL